MDMYQYEKVMTFVDEEDVKFIRLAFFDAFGVQKNISILSGQLERDASGYGYFLHGCPYRAG